MILNIHGTAAIKSFYQINIGREKSICKDIINHYLPWRIGISIRGFIVCHMTVKNLFLSFFLPLVFEQLKLLSGNGKATYLYHQHSSSKPFFILYPF